MADTRPTPSAQGSEASAHPIVTFYSYKGGVGRSMALANLAVMAARDYSLNVIVVDWDLEAPGLHRYFGVPDKDVRDGVIDYIHRYKRLIHEPQRAITESDLSLESALTVVRTFKGATRLSSIRLLAAGSLVDLAEYSRKVQAIDWDKFYREWNGAQLIEAIRKQLKGLADLVLIDSRTGFTDIGGICTLHLPDTVVLVFTFNDQNLTGTERIARQLTEDHEVFTATGRRPELMYLPSRKEVSEIERLREWERMAAERFAPYQQSARAMRQYPDLLDYLRKAAAPYIPYFAFGEELAAETDKGIELINAYRVIASVIVGREPLAVREPARDGKAASAFTLGTRSSPHDSLAHALDAAELSDSQKAGLKARWLDQYAALEARAHRTILTNWVIRTIQAVATVFVPILLYAPDEIANAIPILPYRLALLLSLVAAFCLLARQALVPVEGGYEFRRSAEALKDEGLHFLQLTGRYADSPSQAGAYQGFLARLEHLSQVESDLRVSSELSSHRELAAIESLGLRDTALALIRSRWLEQLAGSRARARHARSYGRLLDLTVLLLSVAVPFLIGFWVVRSSSELARSSTAIMAMALAFLVNVQQLLRFDQTFARNQRIANALDSEGWQFIQQNGDYRHGPHEVTLGMFTERVEAILNPRSYETQRRF